MTKKPKLTKLERRLLEYPPTPTTWWCNNHGRAVLAPAPNYHGGAKPEETVESFIPGKIVNPGSASRCWNCGEPKPAEPELLWPAYLEARRKAGLIPLEQGE